MPQLAQPLAEIAAEMKLSEADLEAQLAPIRAEAARRAGQAHPRPLTDTKILTAENGLMIGGLADAGRILKEPRYVAAAEKAADFVLAKLRDDRGRLLADLCRRRRPSSNGYLNDYAFLADGLIRLHARPATSSWLDRGRRS